MATSKQVLEQFASPLAPINNIGYATGLKSKPAPASTWETFDQPTAYTGAPTAAVDLNDPETKAQLEFYAAISGMSLQEYLDAQAAAGPVKQAPQINNEYRTGVANRQGVSTTGDGAIANAQNAYTSDSNALNTANRAAQENYFTNNVTPALAGQQSAVSNQQSANRLAEAQLRTGGTALNNSLNATQATRNAGINSTNAAQTQALNNLTGSLNSSNAAATSANSRLGSQLNASNAAASAANSRLGTQLAQSNVAQNNTLNSFQNASAQSNAAQDMAAYNLKTDMNMYNDWGDDYANTLEHDLGSLNGEDRASLAEYVAKTNPMLAAQIARGSSDQYVGQQQEVYDKYKALSNPEITAQERFLGEMARRKTESDDKGSRDATYQALKQRGLNSGGQQIAAQLANRQATSQDRMLAELGLSASAQQRAERSLAGQGTVAEQLRNADDKMRNFQDTYAQNDVIRRQQVAQAQQNSSLASTGQQGQRDAQIFDAQRANLNDRTGRSGMTFDAQNTSINANSARDANVFGAGTTTNNANSDRNVQAFDASRATTNDNSGRNVQVFDANRATINDNSGRDVAGYNASTGTNEANYGRSQYGWDSADQNAGVAYNTAKDQVATGIGNRAGEVGSASGLTSSAIGASSQYGNMQNGLTRAQQDALDRLLDNTVVANTPRPKSTNV